MPPVCDIGLRGYRALAERKQLASARALGTGKGTGLLSVLCQPAHCRQGTLPTARSASKFLWLTEPSSDRDPALSSVGLVVAVSFPRRPDCGPGSAAPNPGGRRSTSSTMKAFAPAGFGASYEAGERHRGAHLRGIYFLQGQGTLESSMPSGSRYRRAHPSQGATFRPHHLL